MSRASAVRRLLSMLAVAALFLGVGGTAPSASAVVSPSAETEDAVRESVLRFIFDATPTEARQVGFDPPRPANRQMTYFVSIGNSRDPSPRLLKRFVGHVPVVKPYSAAGWVKGEGWREFGVIYTVGPLHWLNRHRAKLRVWYSDEPHHGMGADLIVVYERGQWRVKHGGNVWES